jgi:bifunctional N-acetylglucosamine-1-phosphate-uridyltransferase/glucosamine-1-phosphate-acetyltransferase GlmU-like protein
MNYSHLTREKITPEFTLQQKHQINGTNDEWNQTTKNSTRIHKQSNKKILEGLQLLKVRNIITNDDIRMQNCTDIVLTTENIHIKEKSMCEVYLEVCKIVYLIQRPPKQDWTNTKE